MRSYISEKLKRRLPSHSNVCVKGYWYSEELDKWFKDTDFNLCSTYSTSDIDHKPKSYKAFIRYVRKHMRYLPKGAEFVWVSDWVGVDSIVVKGR